jgi:hypothetical protein
MTRTRAQGALSGLLAVAIPSALASAVLVRAFTYYQGRDAMAGSIVMLMGLGLLVGVIELARRVGRTAGLSRELAALPDAPREEDVERASPELRALLRARLEQVPPPAQPESITAYLVGLMVMLGLLGTLLGLFETLGGAGHALTASPNVETLRRGLSAPMQGLTRSFGCSAAGVAASAMLGLASVLVRRREVALAGAVQRYAAGALRSLSPLRRQLMALEQLAAQGAALPEAALALGAVGGRIDALSERWESTLVASAKAQEEVIRGSFAGLRERVEAAAQAAAKSLESQLAPVLRSSVESTERAARDHLTALRRSLAEDLAKRGEAEAAQTARSAEALTALADRLAGSLRAQSEAAQAGFARLFDALEARDQQHRDTLTRERSEAAAHVAALGDAARALLEQLDSEAKARREEASRLLGELAGKLDSASRERAAQSQGELEVIASLGERMAHAADAREAQRGEAFAQLAARVGEIASATRSEEEARLARLDALATRIGSDLGQLSGSMTKQLETRLEAETRATARASEAMALVEQSARTLEEALREQRGRLDGLLDASAAQLSALGEKAQSGAATALARITEVASEQGERFASLSAQIAAAQTAQTQGLAGELTAHAERLTGHLAGQATKLTEELSGQAAKLTGELGSQATKLTTELGARTDQLITQLASQAETLTLTLGSQVETLTQAFGERAAALTDAFGGQAERLASTLSAQADELKNGLGGTGKLVDDAAQLLKSSGAEMATVAEMFGRSVERQRETAKTWLETLGELEGAIERVGRGAAADALGDQLASTQEVFARQLQFQRELFEQLRSLRGAAPNGRGEHDASA